MKQKLLVCVNDGEHARTALKFACAKAKREGLAVELITVLDTSEYQGVLPVADAGKTEKYKKAEDILDGFAKLAYEFAEITPSLILKEGFIEDNIVQAIEEDNAIAMLVIGAATDSTSRGKLIATLAAEVGQKLMIPVTIMPDNLTDEQIRKLS